MANLQKLLEPVNRENTVNIINIYKEDYLPNIYVNPKKIKGKHYSNNYIITDPKVGEQKIKDFEDLDDLLKSNILADLHCNVFEYKLNKKVQGKINENEGIFFNITNIEIICFDSGICFLLIKTDLENNQNFSSLLDFNYKFKDINSEFSKLKEYNNIKIQTDAFSNMKDLSQFIQEVIGVNSKFSELKDIDMYNNRFFVYTYACVEQDNWENFDNIENDFIKFTNVLPNSNTIAFNGGKLDKIVETVEQFKNARFGFTKQSATFLASSIDTNNYTKLLFEYDNNYLYTLIFSLYQTFYVLLQSRCGKQTGLCLNVMPHLGQIYLANNKN